MIKTRITEMLGIQYPIIQGGMIWLAKAELAAAVSNAGGLGIITSAELSSPEELRQEIRKTKDLTDKPFGVNINLFPATRPMPNNEFIDVLIEEGVKVVETSGVRSPEEYIPRLRSSNVKVIHKVATVRHAAKAAQMGVDAVSVVGVENGGHTGIDDVTTIILVPLAADLLAVPLIAGGGIGDARGFVAALALGADGVVMGTRFIATRECPAHPRFKEWMLRIKETDTVLVERSIRNTSRSIRNKAAEKVLEMEARGASLEELLTITTGKNYKKVLLEGELDAGIASCGQIVGLIQDIPTVKEVIDNIITGAEIIGQRLSSLGILDN